MKTTLKSITSSSQTNSKTSVVAVDTIISSHKGLVLTVDLNNYMCSCHLHHYYHHPKLWITLKMSRSLSMPYSTCAFALFRHLDENSGTKCQRKGMTMFFWFLSEGSRLTTDRHMTRCWDSFPAQWH